MKTLYFDCFSGVSGNMFLGALIDLGLDQDRLVAELSKLEIGEFELNAERVKRSGISGIYVDPSFPETKRLRHLPEIERIIDESALEEDVKMRSISVFRRLAEAEAKVHGVSVEKIHFHEVGAVDTLIDVVGSVVGLDLLEVDSILVSAINVGGGTVEIEHGTYPVPPPAVAELLVGFKTYSGEVKKELTTPTGAAIVAEFGVTSERRDIVADRIGYGAGGYEFSGHPNVLRATLVGSETETEELVLLETNLDDVTGESLGHFMESAMNAGALDCWFTPIVMKKNRPAHLISVLAEPDKRAELVDLIYSETTSLGVRVSSMDRVCLERVEEVVRTDFGEVRVKVARLDGRIVNYKPEHSDLVRLAKETGNSLKTVANSVAAVCFEEFGEAGKVGQKQAGS